MRALVAMGFADMAALSGICAEKDADDSRTSAATQGFSMSVLLVRVVDRASGTSRGRRRRR